MIQRSLFTLFLIVSLSSIARTQEATPPTLAGVAAAARKARAEAKSGKGPDKVYVYVGAGSPAAPAVVPADTGGTPTSSTRTLQIVDVDARITESNSTWSRFAWKLTVKNLTSARQSFSATIEFQDKDGFIVDSDREYDLPLAGGEQRIFTGDALIKAASVDKIAKINAKIGTR